MQHFDFSNARTFETTIAGQKFTVETGKFAQLANGSCMVRCGDTAVLVTATAASSPRDGVDFFPLSVDFDEKLYSVGRIPGSFIRRESKPSEKAILVSRLIDRPIRPLFPKDMRNDVSIVATVMSVDHDFLPEVAAMLGTSVALSISDIPWDGPIGGVSLGLVDGKYVINPNQAQREKSKMQVTVAGTSERIVMIEAGGDQIPDDVMLDGLLFAHEEIKKITAFVQSIKDKIGKPKFEYQSMAVSEQIFNDIKAFAEQDMKQCLDTADKTVRDARIKDLTEKINAHFAEIYTTPEEQAQFGECIYKLEKTIVRHMLLDEHKRVDGRGITDVRPLAAEVGLLPRVHGSGMFTRGQTQVLTTCTLGTLKEVQELDTIYEETEKRYMHQYNFPSFSVGETKPSRGPGRREIGHGALAERALVPVIPSEEEFPYALRLVSEVLSSNGSTSQGSVCGSTLALMDAGVPIKAPVAGISCGLVEDGDRYITFTDIQGIEDFFGDMDFKVAGTRDGITAIQVDIKNRGLTPQMIREAFEKTRIARIGILDEIMLPCISKPRENISKYAPKLIRFSINPDKIKDVIGKGGSVIQKIVADTDTKIDIEDDGSVCISAISSENCEKAKNIIVAIACDPNPGDMFYGKVLRILPFGAFVEIAPGKDGMVHISKLADHRVGTVEEVLNVGDMTWVMVTDIDEKGRINLSRKDAYKKLGEQNNK